MRTVTQMTFHGRYKVIYDDKAKMNPYRVYEFDGNHRHMIDKYADLASAMQKLTSIATMWESIDGVYGRWIHERI